MFAKPSKGVIYAATGGEFRAEAIRSARSVRRHMPDLPITICADDALPEDCRDRFVRIENPRFSILDKIAALTASDYDYTLFLDTDTLAIEPFGEIFDLLERFDLAAAHAPVRMSWEMKGCPASFPELNTGVILFRKCDEIEELFRRWKNSFEEALRSGTDRPHDQPFFRKELFESTVRFTILTPEYNLRVPFPWFAGGNARVKILHGREPWLSRAAAIVNECPDARVGDGARLSFSSKSLFRRLYCAIRPPRTRRHKRI